MHGMKRMAIAAVLGTLLFGLGDGALGYDSSDLTLVVDRTTRSKALNDYVYLTRDMIQRAWTTPLDLVTAEAVKGKIRITYTLNRSGALQSLQVVEGSGLPELDAGLVKAIRAACPFPEFPEDVTAGSMTIRANFIVAQAPNVPVTRVEYKPEQSEPADAVNPPRPNTPKYLWGVPAGNAMKREEMPEENQPTRPEFKKYRWGSQD
jgi:TonB family protein